MSSEKIIAYDLGTGGIKASLFEVSGLSLANTFSSYDTVYTGSAFHEQDPDDWWNGILKTTNELMGKTGADPNEIVGISISGHSLGVVPVDKDGNLLTHKTPIWSDKRAYKQTLAFFEHIPYETYYMTTGNGFPAECYSVFKMMWYRDNEPEMYSKVYKFLGSKDYCNLRLTGRMCTDNSYASGSGVYSLLERRYLPEFIEASGVDADLFPEILPSHGVVGNLTPEAAAALGLTTNTKVVAGGVDNSCMALGAKGIADGRAYASLGSSAWIAAIGAKPILDFKYKPFVFDHVAEGLYCSATSIFASGSSFRWVRDTICPDLVAKEKAGEIADVYDAMTELAATSPIGANKLIFNPSLAGGAEIEESNNICGGFVGLCMSHNRADMIRSAMEGITYNLNYAMKLLHGYQEGINDLLLVGGTSKSKFWRQMFADIFGMDMIKTNIDQDAASLGAAALAAYGLGYWKDYSPIDEIHKIESIEKPDPEKTAQYNVFYELHRYIAHFMALSGDKLVATEV